VIDEPVTLSGQEQLQVASSKLRALDTKKNERLDGRRRRTSTDARPTSSRIYVAAQKVISGETSGDADEDHVDRHRFSVIRKSKLFLRRTEDGQRLSKFRLHL
jgi:hypothetical protein